MFGQVLRHGLATTVTIRAGCKYRQTSNQSQSDIAILQGQKEEAAQLARESFGADPTDLQGQLAMAQRAISGGNLSEGIRILDEAYVQANCGPHVSYMLGQALMARGAEADVSRAITVFNSARLENLDRELVDPIIVSAMRAMIRLERFIDVENLVKRPEVASSPVMVATIKSFAALKQSNDVVGGQLLDEAIRLRQPEDSGCATDFLARTLMEAGRLTDALPLFQELFNNQTPNFDVGLLLNCAGRLRQDSVILDTCEALYTRGVYDWEFVEFESRYLEEYNFPKAMAATNRPEVLDPALLRPGRFDRQIVLDRPDLAEREAILRVHARKLRVGSDVGLRRLAAETPGMVGADLANIVNEAALNAARRNADEIRQVDFEQAVDRVVLGFEKKGRLISPGEKERVATHEVGHAVVALTVPHADEVRRVSIVPRSIGALGHTLQLPTKDRYLLTEPELEDRITIMLGGRAAEDVVYGGVVSTGASDDLERASALARQMVTHFGMSKHLGELTYGISNESRYLKGPFTLDDKNYSERTAEQIDQDVRQLTDELYERAKRILSGQRPGVDAAVAALIRKETLERPELRNLLDSAKFRAETQLHEATAPTNKTVPG